MWHQNGFVSTTVAVAVCLAFLFMPGAAAEESETLYQQAREVFMNPIATTAELVEAVGWAETAAETSDEVYKYAFGAGALHYRLEDWWKAEGWLLKAYALADDPGAQEDVGAWLKRTRERIVAGRGDRRTFRTRISFVLKGMYADQDDLLRPTESILPEVGADESDGTLRAFFSEQFDLPGRPRTDVQVNMIRRDRFALVGTCSEDALDTHYKKGLEDAYRVLKRQYFPQAGGDVITVLVSEDPHGALELARGLYPDLDGTPDVPYVGLFNRTDNVIVATVGGGYGTLLHELVHALIAEDFADAPRWLNEGMATLYERSMWTRSGLQGLPNWRMEFIGRSGVMALSDFDALVQKPLLDGADLANIRLLFLFLEGQGLVDDLYNAVKRAGRDSSVTDILRHLSDEMTEEHWRRFVDQTREDYQNEVELAYDQPTYREVLFIQRALNRVTDAGLKEDGVWGSCTKAKVVEFQGTHGLEPDGVVGDTTRALLEREFGAKCL